MEKGSLKPWQIGLFVIAIGAVAFGAYSVLFSGRVRLADELTYVDVQTGDLFYYKIRKSAVVPGKNPDTGNASLLPCVRTDTGYRISKHYLTSLDIIPVPPDAVDAATGDVKVSSKPVRTIESAAGGKFKTDDGQADAPEDDAEPTGGE